MYSSFKLESIPLKDIQLDERNPRIVSQTKLISQKAILSYLYEFEGLEKFIKKIASEGKNLGAERPYVVKSGSGYTVIEGNSRIAAYKVLTGMLTPPKEYTDSVPHISQKLKTSLMNIECSIAPNRDALLPIVANAHFGLGDKSKWGYLGSRKAVYDERQDGKTIAKLAKAFDRTQAQIKELILEYLLYLESLKLDWTVQEKSILLNPSVEFNPPVRFLQTKGHKEKIGIRYDKTNLKIIFDGVEAKKKFKHLLLKLVVNPEKGLGATASYDKVFADYGKTRSTTKGKPVKDEKQSGVTFDRKKNAAKSSFAPKPGTLFAYPVTIANRLVVQLMEEAKELNYKRFPAASTFLLRNIVEAILKHIIDLQKANQASRSLDLENSINLCISAGVSLGVNDKKTLKEFKENHLNYLNLGVHGNLIPNADRLIAARDCIDVFVKKNV